MSGKKALVFDIIGKFAHFKTFYSNASSLSYGFPPRTVIIGIIAAILGKERDSYYELLSPSSCNISVSLKEPLRRIIQTVNYIRTKEEDGFKNFNSAINSHLYRKLNTYPISIEILMPVGDYLKYRIYFTSNDAELYSKLKNSLEKEETEFPLYLGLSEFFAEINWIGEFDILQPENNEVLSVIPESLFSSIDYANQKETISLNIEKMPFHFSFDNGFRKITKVKKFVYESNGKLIMLKENDKIYSVNGENIIWMET